MKKRLIALTIMFGCLTLAYAGERYEERDAHYVVGLDGKIRMVLCQAKGNVCTIIIADKLN